MIVVEPLRKIRCVVVAGWLLVPSALEAEVEEGTTKASIELKTMVQQLQSDTSPTANPTGFVRLRLTQANTIV